MSALVIDFTSGHMEERVEMRPCGECQKQVKESE